MVIKPYHVSLELRTLRCLNQRLDLDPESKQLYFNLEKGHEGEQKLAELFKSLPNKWLILHDLLLESGYTIFQIDALLLAHNEIHFFEVKNYEGDFYIESDNWYTITGKEIQNPILQLNRSKSLLRQLLRKHDINLPLKEHIIFTHTEFTLFQAPLNLSIVLPTQLNRFIHQLKTTPSRSNHHGKKLAEKLADQHMKESPYERLPHYEYQQLKKGISCAGCGSLSSNLRGRTVYCGNCCHEEAADDSVMRSIAEIQLLFPDKKLTTNGIYEWCGATVSKKLIRRILSKNFTVQGKGKRTYYAEKQ